MKPSGTGQAGTLESCDARVIVEIFESGGRSIEVDGPMKQVFGEAVAETADKVLERMGIDSARVKIVDRGALDYVIEARTTTAAERALAESERRQGQRECRKA